MSYRLGVDVGGTFTDLLLFDEEKREIALAKVPTTPENQALGIMNGVDEITRQAEISPGEIKFFIDGDSEFPTICGTGTEDYFGGAWNF